MVSVIAFPFNALAGRFIIGSGKGALQQFITRAVLGLINAAALIYLKRSISRTHGKIAGYFYIAFQATQFHVIYYASRTLPNMFAFPLTTIATGMVVRPDADLHTAVFLLSFTAIAFRAEVALLLATTAVYHLITKRLSIVQTIRMGIRGTGTGLLASFLIDSYFWRVRVVPEVFAFMFNVVHGKAAQWGVSPIWQYALDLPKLLLNPLVPLLILVAIRFHRNASLALMVPAFFYIAIYSLQPHKEWRFIIYVVPQLTTVAALGASRLYIDTKSSTYGLRKLVLFGSVVLSGLLSLGMLYISSMNYPGAQAILRLPDTANTYLDVYTCMTGASRFLQSGGTFTKTEDWATLNNVDFWESLDYASVVDPDVLHSVYRTAGVADQWEISSEVEAFSRLPRRSEVLTYPPKLFISETKLYLMRNKGRPEIVNLRAKRAADLYAEWQAAQAEREAEEAASEEEGEKKWYSWVLGVLKNAMMFF